MSKTKFDGWKCDSCEHTWVSRKEGTPIVCPKCKNPYWNKL